MPARPHGRTVCQSQSVRLNACRVPSARARVEGRVGTDARHGQRIRLGRRPGQGPMAVLHPDQVRTVRPARGRVDRWPTVADRMGFYTGITSSM